MLSRTLARVVVVASLLSPSIPRACTAFCAATPDGPLLAKSFDWLTGEGWLVYNERGRSRPMLLGRSNEDRWTSQHASLSLTTVGPGFPISGMNDAGLAVEALVDLSVPPTHTPKPGTLTGIELVQYALDRFGSVEELAVFAQTQQVSQLAVALHFLACDGTGDCAVVEPDRSGTRITRGNALSVRALANGRYTEELEGMIPSAAERWFGLGRPKRGSSQARFSTVAKALKAQRVRGEEDAFALLDQVVLPHRTRWQLVWNLGARTVTVRQREPDVDTLSLNLDAFERRCDGAPLVRRLGGREHAFTRWTETDVRDAEAAVLTQIDAEHPKARALAGRVARATASSTCAPRE